MRHQTYYQIRIEVLMYFDECTVHYSFFHEKFTIKAVQILTFTLPNGLLLCLKSMLFEQIYIFDKAMALTIFVDVFFNRAFVFFGS